MRKLLIVCFVVVLAGCGKGEAVEPVEVKARAEFPVKPADAQPQTSEPAEQVKAKVVAQHEPMTETNDAKAGRSDAIEKLQEPGAEVELNDNGEVTSLALVGSRITDADLAVLKELTKLQELDLTATAVTDGGLVRLEGLTNLQSLNLTGTKISDAGLLHLGGLAELQKLNLSDTPITGAGLVHVAGLTKLQSLGLNRTRIADAALVHLEGLTELRGLGLGSTPITGEGLAHLQDLTSLEYLLISGPLSPTRISCT